MIEDYDFLDRGAPSTLDEFKGRLFFVINFVWERAAIPLIRKFKKVFK
jgi:hypothetical protein